METRTCTKCGRTLPISCFYRAGEGKRYSRCKDCAREQQRELYLRRHGGKIRQHQKSFRRQRIDPRLVIPDTQIQTKEKCNTCIYRTKMNGGEWACFYIVLMKQRRPCASGDKCIVYEPGEPLERRPKEIWGTRGTY